ncbi:DUF7527 domain-containing protein [Haloarchaeobius sp. HRN-SO-5]|uniref:DUF7527 domain-containing protein n=1 Tax=Haloarchaeobius sp. HRN-SO-5 TaxID=3446118 RepID=UPI003EB98A98
MDSRRVERVEGWDSRQFSGGFEELRGYADSEFTGAITTGSTWLFMLNGRIVGVFDGTIDDFDVSSGTVYEAPHPSVPLLYAMQETGGEEQARYYTNDTPVSEADRTLQSGNFTGYIELSENVLSGDYYVVYYGGRSMSCAFIGNSERLHTGDEAFQRADDEVGIYTVMNVDIDVVEIPSPGGVEEPTTEPKSGADGTDDAVSNGRGGVDVAAESADVTIDPTDTGGGSGEPRTGGHADDGFHGQGAEPGVDRGTDPVTEQEASTAADRQPGGHASPTDTSPPPGDSTGDPSSERGEDPLEVPDDVFKEVEREAEQETDPVFEEEAQWRETRSIPSINPDRSESGSEAPASAANQPPTTGGQRGERGGQRDQGAASSQGADPTGQAQPAGTQQPNRQQEPGPADDSPGQATTQGEDAVDRLQQRLSNVENERDELREENGDLHRRIDELEAEKDRLETKLANIRSNLDAQGEAVASAGTQLTPGDALEGTNLFVRYGSKGQPTLETAHAGEAAADAVNENLRIEHHTQFDADDAAVDGRPYVEFLHDTIEFQFVEWFVRDLLYEIRETGNAGPMRDLYDALPEADRAELNGSVSLRYSEDGEEHREQTTFDVVVRDRMGNPLVVANLNDSRDPATEDMMVDFQERAARVKQTSESLSGAFVVTSSFFDPGALETAGEATSGSLLSRDSKKSFVKLSRKSGYHLCLVETRGGEFHINVPEL